MIKGEAVLIKGLVTERIYRLDKNARYFTLPELRPFIASDDNLLAAESNITEHVVPITQFCRPGRPDIYIAYSHEVEDFLGVPISVLIKEKAQAYAELQRLRSLTAWQHIKKAWHLFAVQIARWCA